jgi:hypothetical protein
MSAYTEHMDAARGRATRLPLIDGQGGAGPRKVIPSKTAIEVKL